MITNIKSFKLVRVVIFIMNLGPKNGCGVLFTDDIGNDVRICVI